MKALLLLLAVAVPVTPYPKHPKYLKDYPVETTTKLGDACGAAGEDEGASRKQTAPFCQCVVALITDGLPYGEFKKFEDKAKAGDYRDLAGLFSVAMQGCETMGYYWPNPKKGTTGPKTELKAPQPETRL